MIKGAYDRMKIWLFIAVIVLTILTFFSPAVSWSANAVLGTRILLNLGLLAIADSFGEVAIASPRKDEIFYKWFGLKARLKHLARFTKYAFFGILVFHFGHEYIPNGVHNLATGLGILGFNLMMWRWHKTWSKKWWLNIILTNIATIGLILAFGFNLFDVKWPELAFLLTGFYNLYKMRK